MALKTGFTVQSFAWEDPDGVVVGYLSKFTPPGYKVETIEQGLGPDIVTKKMAGNVTPSTAKASIGVSQATTLYNWIAAVWQKAPVEHSGAVLLANQNYEVMRRIDMTGCMIKQVKLPDLDAKDGKKFFDIDIEFQPESIAFTKGSGKLQSTLGKNHKNWLTSNWVLEIPGIDCKYATKVKLPTMDVALATEYHGAFRHPTFHYSAPKLSSWSVELSNPGFESALAVAKKQLQDGILSEGDFVDCRVVILDQSCTKELGEIILKSCGIIKFDWSPALEGGKDGQALCTIEWMIEEMEMKINVK